MIRRIFVEKKADFAIVAKELQNEMTQYLGIDSERVRALIRYDIENLSDETYEKAKVTVFSEPPVDDLYEEDFPHEESDFVFTVEYLPGQFDQRADSATQCVCLLNPAEEPIIRSATTYVISGNLSEEQRAAVVKHCVNPVDSRVTDAAKPDTLVEHYDEPEDVKVFDGFKDMAEPELKELYESLGLAMTFADFNHIQRYFHDEEQRDPSMTEIRVLDTYWSDHCRHTTFATELTDVQFDEGHYRPLIEGAFQQYLADHKAQYEGRDDKYVCLMDIGTLAAKRIRKMGLLNDQEVSDEINACSIVVPVKMDGKTEEWLINFKNETHNHPTEIEPFGGAATCLGGCIRDPLSGRTYVYQAMRVTGAADPTKPLSETLPGKLPQRKIVTTAAHGYSSYGNQIGLATGLVNEIYHPNYVAKRMEIGAVVAAAPRRQVKRLTSDPGDVVILLGGRTGRDGCGGATGASKAHNTASLTTCGAEVQKGNAPTERKIQRLFRREEVSGLIKKCNDFGAGGVSVAIGELADGLQINLDKVPKKYAGLDGTELAISESQERMAVVVDPKDVDKMLQYADEENLEAVVVATVTEEPRMVITWRGKEVVNLSRRFIDTNGAHQETAVKVALPGEKEGAKPEGEDTVKDRWLKNLSDLNVCSQKGLVEMFDSTIGAGSVVMPYGGETQMTPTQSMIGQLPTLTAKCNTVTIMSYGFDPYLSSWSPFHGAAYAVVDSVAKVVAAGGDVSKIRLTFQEYFKKLGQDPYRWGQPFSALLGAYNAQMGFKLPAIGGKDSMSGTFNDGHQRHEACGDPRVEECGQLPLPAGGETRPDGYAQLQDADCHVQSGASSREPWRCEVGLRCRIRRHCGGGEQDGLRQPAGRGVRQPLPGRRAVREEVRRPCGGGGKLWRAASGGTPDWHRDPVRGQRHSLHRGRRDDNDERDAAGLDEPTGGYLPHNEWSRYSPAAAQVLFQSAACLPVQAQGGEAQGVHPGVPRHQLRVRLGPCLPQGRGRGGDPRVPQPKRQPDS